MKKRIFAVIIAFTLLLSIVSCGKSQMESANMGSYDKGFEYDAPADYEDSYHSDMSGVGSAPKVEYVVESNTTAQNDLANRKIIKNANISFQTTTYDQFISAVNACISSYGGYTEKSESYGGGAYQSNYSRSASITARIPADNYDRFMNEVASLGSVTHRSENSNDVTSSYVDTESRIKALEAEYNALLAILEKATKLDDVISLQARISEVTYQLESYKSRLRKYDDLISYCTVYMSISEVRKEVVNEDKLSLGERMSEGLNDTVNEMKEDLEDFSVDFVSSLPYIAIWVVIIAVGLIIITRTLKKHRKNSAKGSKDENKDSEK